MNLSKTKSKQDRMQGKRALLSGVTDLPVLLPFGGRQNKENPHKTKYWALRIFKSSWGLAIFACLGIFIIVDAVFAQNGSTNPSMWSILLKWSPMIFWGGPGEMGGFVLNMVISFTTMGIGTIAGLFVGIGLMSEGKIVRGFCWGYTQFFRNAPWLVMMFYVMLFTPYQFNIGGLEIEFSPWFKSALGLAFPVSANVAEVVRGAVQSIPSSQWESAKSLAFRPWQITWLIILPQCVKRMIPPWMNWYAILTMATPIVSIVGVNDAMLLTRDALASEGNAAVLVPMYLWLLSWFFIYCYPIARLTLRLEDKFRVDA